MCSAVAFEDRGCSKLLDGPVEVVTVSRYSFKKLIFNEKQPLLEAGYYQEVGDAA